MVVSGKIFHPLAMAIKGGIIRKKWEKK